MPKQRITRENVIDAAFEIARIGGMEAVTVKSIADRLGCSVQPIYSYCSSMEGLRRGVIEKTVRFVREYADARTDKDDPFRSTGRAYVSLAKEEPNLFALFIFHKRNGVSSLEDFYGSEADPRTAEFIAERLEMSVSQARKLHLDMLIYTIGIGTVFAMTEPGIRAEEIYAQQEEAYEAFLAHATSSEKEL